MSAVIWHDVECGAYAADLKLWEELADEAGGPVLDLGCGTGRVSLHLARRGHRVVGLDSEAALLAALEKRANGLSVETALGDAQSFEIEEEFGLVLAPMQFVQLFDTPAERIACLSSAASHLRPGGTIALAIALAEEVLGGENIDPMEIAPDVREVDGWVYSSHTREIVVDPEKIAIRRRRERVSPEGSLTDDLDEVILRVLTAETLESEGRAAGLKPAGRRSIPPTDDHVGSTVVLLEAP
ncbi:MAG TPA: class I SAM-dependent methyltransferase [Solirubrobacterales bacterium]|nr:class I SAM-dependent methyltransferase [Solirubrobacterales bacterium]